MRNQHIAGFDMVWNFATRTVVPMKTTAGRFSSTAEKIQMRDVAQQQKTLLTPGRWIRPFVGLVALAISTATGLHAADGGAQIRIVSYGGGETDSAGQSYFAASIHPAASDA